MKEEGTRSKRTPHGWNRSRSRRRDSQLRSSVVSNFQRRARPPRATPPRGSSASAINQSIDQSHGPARSVLKMKRVDPPVRGFPRCTGWVMPERWGEAASTAGRVGAAVLNGSVDENAIHLHGSTPHRNSRVVSGHRARRRAAEPIKRASTTTRRANQSMNGQVSETKARNRCPGIKKMRSTVHSTATAARKTTGAKAGKQLRLCEKAMKN